MNERTPVEDARIFEALKLMHGKKFSEADVLLQEGLKNSIDVKDKKLMALFYAHLGLLGLQEENFKKAIENYQKAEKLLPGEPHLKLSIAQIQMDVFQQYDLAEKRLHRVLKIAFDNPPVLHHTFTGLGFIYLKKGREKKAIEYLISSIQEDFKGMITSSNISFKLLEALIRENAGILECAYFLQKASLFAESLKEKEFVKVCKLILSEMRVVSKKK